MQSPPLNRRKKKQPLHDRSVSHVGLAGLLYVLSLFIFFHQGSISDEAFTYGTLIVACFFIAFYMVFKFQLNTYFYEPSLTLPQIMASILTMLAVAYLDRSAQIALAPFILIAFSFGVFRLSIRSMIFLCISCLCAYLAMILIRDHQQGYPADLRSDLLQWFVLALTLPGMIAVANQVRQLRKLLKTTRYQLEHYEEKAIRDELTGLYNRRQIQIELEQAKLQANSLGIPFCICLVDIDHFKSINDRNGHLAGDMILREFACIARGSIRDSDIFGRYGGDEFLHILADTDLKGAVMHAERLRVHANFLNTQNTLPQKSISLSIGVAQYRAGEEITDLIGRADTGLYQAKQFGRNRVEWVEEVRASQAPDQTLDCSREKPPAAVS